MPGPNTGISQNRQGPTMLSPPPKTVDFHRPVPQKPGLTVAGPGTDKGRLSTLIFCGLSKVESSKRHRTLNSLPLSRPRIFAPPSKTLSW